MNDLINTASGAAGAANSQLQNVGDMLISLTESFDNFYWLISAFCYVGAFVLLMSSIRKLSLVSASNGRGDQTYGGVLAAMVFGVLLAWIPELITSVSCTAAIAQEEARSVLDYRPSTASSNEYVNAIFDLLRLIGIIAFIKSIFMMRQIAGGLAPREITWGSAFWMMIGGIACYNIVPVIEVMAATFGLSGIITRLGLTENATTYGC